MIIIIMLCVLLGGCSDARRRRTPPTPVFLPRRRRRKKCTAWFGVNGLFENYKNLARIKKLRAKVAPRTNVRNISSKFSDFKCLRSTAPSFNSTCIMQDTKHQVSWSTYSYKCLVPCVSVVFMNDTCKHRCCFRWKVFDEKMKPRRRTPPPPGFLPRRRRFL